MRKYSVFLLVLSLLLAGCAPRGVTTLTVLAAASLSGPFEEIAQVFEARHPGVTVAFNFAGSQQLVQPLAQGAPADVFASANQVQMDAAVAAGRVDSSASLVFVRNRLVVILPLDNPARISSLSDLARPGLKLILAAKEVPAGKYSLEFLDRAAQDADFGSGYKDAVLRNVVSYEDNVRAVLTKVALGEADAGIVYASDSAPGSSQAAPGKSNAGQVTQIGIPDALNITANYPIAAVADSKQPDLAQEFIELVLSNEGQEILRKYGFLPNE